MSARQSANTTPVLLSTGGPECLGIEARAFNLQFTSVAVQSGAANRAWYVPLYLSRAVIVLKLWWLNGTGIAGNVDMGIYRASDLGKVVSTGAVAQSGASVMQAVDIADTALAAGTYYLAFSASDVATANFGGVLISPGELIRVLGVTMEESAHPLPATLTPIAWGTNNTIPTMGLAFRTLVA